MKSANEVLTADSFDPGKIGMVMDQLMALPINGGEKINILQAWSRAVGAKVSASQYNKVEASGLDNIT